MKKYNGEYGEQDDHNVWNSESSTAIQQVKAHKGRIATVAVDARCDQFGVLVRGKPSSPVGAHGLHGNDDPHLVITPFDFTSLADSVSRLPNSAAVGTCPEAQMLIFVPAGGKIPTASSHPGGVLGHSEYDISNHFHKELGMGYRK